MKKQIEINISKKNNDILEKYEFDFNKYFESMVKEVANYYEYISKLEIRLKEAEKKNDIKTITFLKATIDSAKRMSKKR